MKSLIVALVAFSAVTASAKLVEVTACYGETNICQTVLVKERSGAMVEPAAGPASSEYEVQAPKVTSTELLQKLDKWFGFGKTPATDAVKKIDYSNGGPN